jgi:hypothetical protein
MPGQAPARQTRIHGVDVVGPGLGASRAALTATPPPIPAVRAWAPSAHRLPQLFSAVLCDKQLPMPLPLHLPRPLLEWLRLRLCL